MKIQGSHGSYHVIKRLGRGGFAEILLARTNGELVVVKLPKDDEMSKILLKEEASLLRELSIPSPHEHIVSFIEWIDRVPALVEEYVPGPTVGEAYGDRRATQNDAIRISLGVLSALERMHSLGVVHGDVKPDNIILPRSLHPVLIDLGVARAVGKRSVAGTPGWSAPEFLEGEVSPEADIYSVGVLIIFLVYGIDPREPIRPEELPKNLSGNLRYVLSRALDPDPRNRFSSARDMSLALMGMKLPSESGPRIVVQGRGIPLRDKITIGRIRRQGGTGRADVNLQEVGSRRSLPPGPPRGWIEIVRVGGEYWISDRGSPGGVWVYEGGKWVKVLDYPLKHGQLISFGLRRRGRDVLPYIPARVYLR
ncbi:MAG: FHA domain-containing serine/threonine-protein kinase [Candidatus Korarchaeota archaeon]|nr:FHA domain-containing serine/threonine-protein kinase [Candidatus Korarchaeota archaeon]